MVYGLQKKGKKGSKKGAKGKEGNNKELPPVAMELALELIIPEVLQVERHQPSLLGSNGV